ncbi:uncharacterized protein LOC135224689 isoform X2 [Macrobrachium nipponense]|uniref:uncharacterized protein LOC135224689 isoform X2 n=1 Tax=Macrobrachium nipponense TaxID=159736 RepID=UPI0030C8AC4F
MEQQPSLSRPLSRTLSFSPSSCRVLRTPCSSHSWSSTTSSSSHSSYATYPSTYRPLIPRPLSRSQSFRCRRRLFDSFKEILPPLPAAPAPAPMQSSPKDRAGVRSRDNARKAQTSFFLEGLPHRRIVRPQFRIFRELGSGQSPENVEKQRQSSKQPLRSSDLDYLLTKRKTSATPSKSSEVENQLPSGTPSGTPTTSDEERSSPSVVVINDAKKLQCQDECDALEFKPIRI